jgi:exopolysaccharide production protein ExoZ
MPSPVPSFDSGRFERLQALRALAALAVLASHLVEQLNGPFDRVLAFPGLGLGWIGVDVFFVLSGFIIARSADGLGHGLRPAAAFIVARAARIYPPWWAALIFMIALLGLFPAAGIMHGQADLLHSVLLMPDPGQPILPVGWTLVMELAFYLGFAVLIAMPASWRWWAIGVWATAIIWLAGSEARLTSPLPMLFFNPLCLEFLFGVLLARFAERLRPLAGGPRSVRFAAGTAVLTMLAGAVCTQAAHEISPLFGEWTRAIGIGLPATLLVWCALQMDLAGPRFATRLWRGWLVALGDRSYALYLVHFPIVGLAAGLIAPHAPSPAGALIFVASATLVSIVLADVLHAVVERPSIRLGAGARV